MKTSDSYGFKEEYEVRLLLSVLLLLVLEAASVVLVSWLVPVAKADILLTVQYIKISGMYCTHNFNVENNKKLIMKIDDVLCDVLASH